MTEEEQASHDALEFVLTLRRQLGGFLMSGDTMLAKATIFHLARMMQELSIATCNKDVPAGMQLLSSAINASNRLALKTISRLDDPL